MNAATPLVAQPPALQANVPPPHATAAYAMNTSYSQTAPTQTLNATAGAQPPVSSAAMFGTSRSQPILANAPPSARPQPPQVATLTNANYAPSTPVGTMQPPLPPTSAAATALQQNQLNNNTQQQTSTLRKPMYPTGPPPMVATSPLQQQQPQLQQQQQQPYAPVYQPQPGVFNGQPSTAPLQYQTQPYMQQTPPVHQQQFSQPQQQQPQQTPNFPIPSGDAYNQQMSVTQAGFSRLWGQDTIDLMQNRHILSPATLTPPRIVLNNQFHESINCNLK